MIQEQLVDYISSQMKLGVSQDAIKATLVGAGWSAIDVDDTFKKINSGGAVAAQPAATSPAAGAVKVAAKPAEPQTIRVSDLVSASSSSAVSAAATTAKVSPLAKPTTATTATVTTATTPMTMSGTMAASSKKSSGGSMMTIVWIVLVVIFAGLAGYFFYQNMTLSSQAGAASAQQNQGASSQIATLESQISALTASSTAMTTQITTLSTSNQTLKMELSLFVPPSNGATSTPFTMSGAISEVKSVFYLMTIDGTKASVKNSSDVNVKAALQPLASSSATAQLGGTYIPGTDMLTVETVNGTSVDPVVATTTAATSTATSTTATTTPSTATTSTASTTSGTSQ